MTAPVHNAVPRRYQGVWVRTLLETPEGRDSSTWVRWLQAGDWHGDLRVPSDIDRQSLPGLALQQGFGGLTTITRPDPTRPEVCTWHRRIDFQPPRSTPDAGQMVFESSERLIETGIHGPYLEVWERLPDSLGPHFALLRLDTHGHPTDEQLLRAGRYLMHLRPRRMAWPADVQADESLAEVLQRHPAHSTALLDFDIAFGVWAQGQWTVERATRPAQEGRSMRLQLKRPDQDQVQILGPAPDLAGHWLVQAWAE